MLTLKHGVLLVVAAVIVLVAMGACADKPAATPAQGPTPTPTPGPRPEPASPSALEPAGTPEPIRTAIPTPEPTPTPAPVSAPASGCSPEQVDINTASKETLRKIIHIDEVRADQILALRQKQRFGSVDDMTRIRGIATERLRDIKKQGLACAGG
jgi:hypothetical protein